MVSLVTNTTTLGKAIVIGLVAAIIYVATLAYRLHKNHWPHLVKPTRIALIILAYAVELLLIVFFVLLMVGIYTFNGPD